MCLTRVLISKLWGIFLSYWNVQSCFNKFVYENKKCRLCSSNFASSNLFSCERVSRECLTVCVRMREFGERVTSPRRGNADTKRRAAARCGRAGGLGWGEEGQRQVVWGGEGSSSNESAASPATLLRPWRCGTWSHPMAFWRNWHARPGSVRPAQIVPSKRLASSFRCTRKSSQPCFKLICKLNCHFAVWFGRSWHSERTHVYALCHKGTQRVQLLKALFSFVCF